jgi:hypothetical protein
MQVLATAPGGIADQFPKDMMRLYRQSSRLWRRPAVTTTVPAGNPVADARVGESGNP